MGETYTNYLSGREYGNQDEIKKYMELMDD